MEKDFDRWNGQKKQIDRRTDAVPLFHEREIWLCTLGVNVGSEQDGATDSFERPVLVIKNFNGLVLWVLPLTRTAKPNRFYYRLSDTSENSSVVLSQLRLISSKRLIRKIRTLDTRQFGEIIAMLRGFLSS